MKIFKKLKQYVGSIRLKPQREKRSQKHTETNNMPKGTKLSPIGPQLTNLIEELPEGFRVLTDAEKATASKSDFDAIKCLKGVWVNPKDKEGQLHNHDTYIVKDIPKMSLAEAEAALGVKIV